MGFIKQKLAALTWDYEEVAAIPGLMVQEVQTMHVPAKQRAIATPSPFQKAYHNLVLGVLLACGHGVQEVWLNGQRRQLRRRCCSHLSSSWKEGQP